MSRTSKILRNIASNWTGFVISAAVTIVLTPFVLRQLGEARYGVWVLTSSIVGYYGLLDLGFRSGVNQYLTRDVAVRDHRRASETLSTAVVALSALGALIAALSLAAAYVVPRVADLPGDIAWEASWCILIVGLAASVQCTFFPFAAVFVATQRFDLANLIGVGTRLFTAGATWVALLNGYGLVGISVATCGGSLIDYLIRWRVAYRLAPELRFARRSANLARLREIGSFGGWNFLVSVSAYIYLHAQTLLIGWLMPIAAVGYYALAIGLARQVGDVLRPVGQVIYPTAAELHARGEDDALQRLYRDGSRLMLLVTIAVVLIASFWAEDFYRLWIGETYLRGTPFPSVALLLQVVLIGTMAGYASNIAGQVLLGAGHVRLLAIANISGAGLTLALTLVLIRPFGLVGVAAASVAAAVVAELIAIPIILQKVLGLRAWYRLASVWVRPVVVGVLLVVYIACLRGLGGRPDGWLHLILYGMLTGAGAAVLVLIVGLTAAERERLLAQPMRRLLRKWVPAPVDIPR